MVKKCQHNVLFFVGVYCITVSGFGNSSLLDQNSKCSIPTLGYSLYIVVRAYHHQYALLFQKYVIVNTNCSELLTSWCWLYGLRRNKAFLFERIGSLFVLETVPCRYNSCVLEQQIMVGSCRAGQMGSGVLRDCLVHNYLGGSVGASPFLSLRLKIISIYKI